jgi:hypothetical protein
MKEIMVSYLPKQKAGSFTRQITIISRQNDEGSKMEYQKILHEIIFEHIRKELSRDYKEIGINKEGEKNIAYKGHYPHMILGNHGMVVALLEIETDESITAERAKRWRELSGLGVKLIIMVPKNMKVKTTELIWNKSLMDKVSLGTYEIVIKMP